MFELYHKAIKKARVFLAKPGFFLFFYVLIELSKWQTRGILEKVSICGLETTDYFCYNII